MWQVVKPALIVGIPLVIGVPVVINLLNVSKTVGLVLFFLAVAVPSAVLMEADGRRRGGARRRFRRTAS